MSSISPQNLFGCQEILLTKSCREEYPQICGIAASMDTFSEAEQNMNFLPDKKCEHKMKYRFEMMY